MRMTEQIKFIADKWNKLDPIEKNDWQAKSELDKARYMEEINKINNQRNEQYSTVMKPLNPVIL